MVFHIFPMCLSFLVLICLLIFPLFFAPAFPCFTIFDVSVSLSSFLSLIHDSYFNLSLSLSRLLYIPLTFDLHPIHTDLPFYLSITHLHFPRAFWTAFLNQPNFLNSKRAESSISHPLIFVSHHLTAILMSVCRPQPRRSKV